MVVVILGAGVGGVTYYYRYNARQALDAYDRVLADIANIMNQIPPVGSDGDSEQARKEKRRAREEAVRGLEQIRTKYKSTTQGRHVLLDLGALYYRLEKYEKAKQSYLTFLDSLKSGENDIKPLVLDSLAYIYLADKKYDQAAEYWQEVLSMPGGILKQEAHLNLARVYEAQGQKEKAIQAYQTLIKEFPDSPNLTMAKAGLHRLSAGQSE